MKNSYKGPFDMDGGNKGSVHGTTLQKHPSHPHLDACCECNTRPVSEELDGWIKCRMVRDAYLYRTFYCGMNRPWQISKLLTNLVDQSAISLALNQVWCITDTICNEPRCRFCFNNLAAKSASLSLATIHASSNSPASLITLSLALRISFLIKLPFPS